jgi:hypothetical protein
MREQVICENLKMGGKISYRTKAAAEKKRRQSREPLWVYECPHGDHFHLTSQPRYRKPEPAPSLRKLRAHLEAIGRTIAAQTRRLAVSEKRLAEELARAEEQKHRAQQAHREELAAITAMTNRIRRV